MDSLTRLPIVRAGILKCRGPKPAIALVRFGGRSYISSEANAEVELLTHFAASRLKSVRCTGFRNDKEATNATHQVFADEVAQGCACFRRGRAVYVSFHKREHMRALFEMIH